MIAPAKVLAGLTRLLREGSLPRSACSATLIRTLTPLVDAGVVRETRSGAGRRLVLENAQALREFVAREFPGVSIPHEAGSRAAGVAQFRESKSFRNDTAEIISIRAWGDGCLFQEHRRIDAAAATSAHGLFSFLMPDKLDGGKQSEMPEIRMPCALVENPAVFTQFEKLGLPIQLVIYGRGRISTRLAKWFESMPAADFHLLHIPDYDPVGLCEFERLRQRLGSRVSLYLPPDLSKRFDRFSNRSLLQRSNSRALLLRLRQSEVPEINSVVKLIDQYNAGLEQEALLF